MLNEVRNGLLQPRAYLHWSCRTIYRLVRYTRSGTRVPPPPPPFTPASPDPSTLRPPASQPTRSHTKGLVINYWEGGYKTGGGASEVLTLPKKSGGGALTGIFLENNFKYRNAHNNVFGWAIFTNNRAFSLYHVDYLTFSGGGMAP